MEISKEAMERLFDHLRPNGTSYELSSEKIMICTHMFYDESKRKRDNPTREEYVLTITFFHDIFQRHCPIDPEENEEDFEKKIAKERFNILMDFMNHVKERRRNYITEGNKFIANDLRFLRERYKEYGVPVVED